MMDRQPLLIKSSKKKGKSFGPLSTTLLSSNHNTNNTNNNNSQSWASSDLKRNASSPTSMSPDMMASTGLMMMMNAGSGGGLLTPSLSVGSSVVMSLSPSLKSRESAVSVGGGGGVESDQSFGPANATTGNGGEQGLRVHVGDESSGGGGGSGVNVSGGGGGGEKTKATNKLKRYKEGAEKVLMLFSSAGSPKQHHHAS